MAKKSQNQKSDKNCQNVEKTAYSEIFIANYSQLIILFVITLALGITAPQIGHAQTENPAPMVIELFTSRYCPACPKADRNFNALIAENANIIGLSCHVTYFNRGSRKDLLSKPFCDARQNIYKLTLKTGGIFTPMMVENGSSFTTGIKQSHIQTLKNKAKNAKIRPVGFLQNGEYLDINLPQMQLSKNASVWLFEIEKRSTKPGYEHYRNSVVNITKLMNWSGKHIEMAFPVKAKDANTAYAIVVQNFKGGVVAAGLTAP